MPSFVTEKYMGFMALSSSAYTTETNFNSDTYDSLLSDVKSESTNDVLNNSSNKNIDDSDDNIGNKNNNNKDIYGNEMDSVKLCSNCLSDINIKNEEYFENEECGHVLCLRCRFVQDNVCKICKIKQEELKNSVALDLSTSYSATSFNSNDCSNNSSNCGKGKKSKVKNFVIPSYIEVLSNDPPKYRCSICKRVFHYKLQSKYHEACFTGERPLKCNICDKTFIKKTHLDYHLKSHTGDKQYVCDVCDKGFIQKSKLKRHMSTHIGDKPFKCDICCQSFTAKQPLQVHLRSHTGERPFPCKHCRRTFKDRNNLRKHELKHTGIRNFVCEDCGKSFSIKWNLMNHKKFHNGIKNYSCKVCGKTFILKTDVARHMLVHSDVEHDYECSICITPFNRKDNLERHMKHKHPETVSKSGRPNHIVSVVKVAFNFPSETENKFSGNINKNKNSNNDKVLNSSCNQKAEIDEKIKNSLNSINKINKGVHECNKNISIGLSEDKINCDKELAADETKHGSSNNNNKIPENNPENKLILIDKSKELNEQSLDKITYHVSEKDKENLNNSSSSLLTLSSPVPHVTNQLTVKELDSKCNKESVPNFRKVSVISSTKTYLNNVNKLTKINRVTNNNINNNNSSNSKKKSESISPYRLITPPVKSPDTNGRNCVPTITKVTHIVHTSDNGVSNIKTVITTRDVPEKSNKTDKNKQKNLSSKLNVESKEQREKSVIKYTPKTLKNNIEMKHKCYRILNQNINSSFASSNSNTLPVLQPINVGDDSLLSETALSIRNISYDTNSYNENCQTNYNSMFNTLYKNVTSCDDCSMEPSTLLNGYNNNNNTNNSCDNFQNDFTRFQNENFEYEIDKVYTILSTDNINKNIQSYNNISESCLLSDNVLDDTITASLYLQSSDYSGTSNVFTNNHPHVLSNNQSLECISSVRNAMNDYNHCDQTIEEMNESNIFINESNTSDSIVSGNIGVNRQLIHSNLTKPSTSFFDNEMDYSCLQLNNSMKTTNNFRDCSLNIPPTFIDKDICQLNSTIKNKSEQNNNFESNGLFTLANMACQRANFEYSDMDDEM
ncbi:uncharacterized protein LOC142330673 [Lycorma delicatula]|uniref:uncharacterized protein LOC142330673 n=1 Tax=Lycorma delicatula TaxID=130591 RepID=UPI003F517925